MKKVNFKSILTALALTLTFLLAGVERVNAQATPTDLSAPPTGTFVDSDVAKQRLIDQMQVNKNTLVNLAPNTATYKALDAKNRYLQDIYQNIEDGKTVPVSIADPLLKYSTDLTYVVTTKQLYYWKVDAVDLLN